MSRTKRYHSYRRQVQVVTNRNKPAVPYGHTLDHIVPVSVGFNRDIPAELIGSAENLEPVPFQENLQKGARVGPKACDLLRRWGFDHVSETYEARRCDAHE